MRDRTMIHVLGMHGLQPDSYRVRASGINGVTMKLTTTNTIYQHIRTNMKDMSYEAKLEAVKDIYFKPGYFTSFVTFKYLDGQYKGETGSFDLPYSAPYTKK